jgi:hypothetical protein
MDDSELVDLTQRWDELMLALCVAEHDELPWPVRKTGTVLRKPAGSGAIADLEGRLGVSLPPSYRSFLGLSDGAWAQPGWGLTGHRRPPHEAAELRALGLLNAAQVGWFRDREPAYVDIWGSDFGEKDGPAHPGFAREVSETHYLDQQRSGEAHKFGQLLYTLQISVDIDGYTILLNPLVVDADGEWEAWDFGSKTVGGARHRSFGELLAADIRQKERRLGRARTLDLDALEATARDATAASTARRAALIQLSSPMLAARVLDLLLNEADVSDDLGRRQNALRALANLEDERILPAFVAASEDSEPRIRAAVIGRLAAAAHAGAREAAVTMLINEDELDFVVRSVWPNGADAVYEAWSLTGSARLLQQLAYCSDPRSVTPLAQALLDTTISASQREDLIGYAWWPHDPALVPALVAAADLPSAPLYKIGTALLHLGAIDDAVTILVKALPADRYGQAVQALGRLDHPAATSALIALCQTRPTAALLRALGWTHGDDVVAALASAAARPTVHLAAVDGLEKMREPGAADALAVLAQEGDLDAARALARRRDSRAAPWLIALLTSDDQDLVFEGVDGLRDLRNPSTAPALFDVISRGSTPDVLAAATHALITMRADQADRAVQRLRESPDEDLRRLGAIWRPSP